MDARKWAHNWRHESGHHQGGQVERYFGRQGDRFRLASECTLKVLVQSGHLLVVTEKVTEQINPPERQDTEAEAGHDIPDTEPTELRELVIDAPTCVFYLAWLRDENPNIIHIEANPS